jgi:hypothetical protein
MLKDKWRILPWWIGSGTTGLARECGSEHVDDLGCDVRNTSQGWQIRVDG